MKNKTNAAPETGAPKDMPLRDSEEQTYAVNVDGQTMELTLEQLIAAAEQGLSKANAAAYRGQAAENMPGGNVYQAFLEEYPEKQEVRVSVQIFGNEASAIFQKKELKYR